MATCYDNRAIVSRAAAVLHAVIAWTGSFIRHACTSHNETGEGVSVSWWLASLLCFLLFALERRTRAIVLPQTVSLYRPGEFYCSHRFHWGIYMPFQPFLFTHSLLNLSATTMYLQHAHADIPGGKWFLQETLLRCAHGLRNEMQKKKKRALQTRLRQA